MTAKTSPFLDAFYGWPYGSNGWSGGMDENLLKFSFMFDGNVDSIVASLPPVSNGAAHFNSTDNRFYFGVGGVWYSSPCPKSFIFKIKSNGDFYQFNGTSAVKIDNPSEIDSRLDAVELTLSSLGTAAFQNIEDFATQAELDIVEGQAQGYTDVLRNDLANATDPAKGAGMVARSVQCVDSVAGIRSLNKSSHSKYADTSGYYDPGDGGSARYYLDIFDTSTADNGATVIVAADGGRWKLLHGGEISLKQVGIRADGVTDDSVMLQSVVNSVPRGTTLILTGVSYLASTVTIIKTLTIRTATSGYGGQRSGFANTIDPNITMFKVLAHSVRFEGGTFEGPGDDTNSVCIELGDGVTNYDSFTLDCDAVAFNFGTGIVASCQNWAIRGGAGASTCGIGVDLRTVPGSGNQNRNVRFSGATLHSCGTGIVNTSGSDYFACSVTGCDFSSCTVSGVSGRFNSTTISGNVFAYGGYGVDITGSSNTIAGNSITGATLGLSPTEGDGVRLVGNYNTVSCNVITTKVGNGVYTNGVGNIVSDNTLFDNNVRNLPGFDGIKVAGNLTRVTNNISRCSSNTKHEYGINVVSGNNVLVSGNHVDGNKLGQITGSARINNNTGYITESKGSVVIPPGDTSVVVDHGLSVSPPSGSILLSLVGGSPTGTTSVRVVGVTSSTFTIGANAAPGGSGQVVWWRAEA